MKKRGTLGITTAFTVVAAAIVLLVIVVSNLVTFWYLQPTVRRNFVLQYEQIFSQADAQLDGTLQNIVRMAAALSTDSELIGAVNLMKNAPTQDERVQSEAYARYLLENAASYYPHIDNVGIYLQSSQVMMNELRTQDYHEAIPRETWFLRLLAGAIETVFITGYPMQKTYLSNAENPRQEYCIYATRFNDSVHARNPGILLVSIEQQYIEGFFAQPDASDGRIIALFDKADTLIFSSDTARSAQLETLGPTLAVQPSDTTITLGQEEFFYVGRTNQQSSWRMVALIPTQALYGEVRGLQRFLVAGAVLAGLLGILLSAALGRAVTHPFHTLMESMDRAGQGDLHRTHKKSGIREVNALFTRYDDMLRRIDRLISQVKEAEGEKRTAELSALQAQINPHFTYNTLNSIQWVARMQNAAPVAEMIGLFSKLLRLTTSHTEDLITVEEELRQIECYIDIMKLRYNREITVATHVAPGLESCRTLKLILQPIVENSFMHGFSNLERDGSITIGVEAQGETLLITVQDDGEGFTLPEGQLPQASAGGAAQLHRGIGVTNVQARIRAWFGPGYGLSFQSAPGRGTRVTITQPLRCGPQEDPETASEAPPTV